MSSLFNVPSLACPSVGIPNLGNSDLNNDLLNIGRVSPPLHTPPGRVSGRNPLEVFVGNLSYFCEESHLFDLFNQYAVVTNVRILRSDDKKRSLMYGFVMFTSRQEVEEMSKLLNGHLFLGRNIRVEPSEGVGSSGVMPRRKEGFQVHVAISSNFTTNQVIKPTETLLRKFFMRYGSIVDVQVNWYNIVAMSNRQEGYAFVSFEDFASFETVLMNPTQIIDGITLVCTRSNGGTGHSHHNNVHNAKHFANKGQCVQSYSNMNPFHRFATNNHPMDRYAHSASF